MTASERFFGKGVLQRALPGAAPPLPRILVRSARAPLGLMSQEDTMTGKAAIAKILKLEGTEYLFCFPANAVIDACAAEGIRPILTRTERTLVNMADGYSRVSNGRRIGVAMVQNGPGSENAFAGLAQAFSDGVPLLYMPGGSARRQQGVPPHFEAVPNYRGVTKWAANVNFADRIPGLMP